MTFKNKKLFKVAEIAKFNPDERMDYEESVKIYRDLKNSIDTAREEGGEKRDIEIAMNLLRMNMPIESIIEVTGLTMEELLKLKGEKL